MPTMALAVAMLISGSSTLVESDSSMIEWIGKKKERKCCKSELMQTKAKTLKLHNLPKDKVEKTPSYNLKPT